jgi:hypothetical protein
MILNRGLVCYRDTDRISFNPSDASAVTYFESGSGYLAVFLHLLMYELRIILEARRKCVAYNALLSDSEYGPLLSRGLNHFDTKFHVIQAALSLAAVIDSDFPDLSSYFNAALQDKLATEAKTIEL